MTATRINVPADAPAWAQRLATSIERALEDRDRVPGKPYALGGPFDSSMLPDAEKCAGCAVYVSDQNAPAYSDGTVWRYFDGSAV